MNPILSTFIVLMLIISISNTQAQTPHLNFSGRVADENGVPLKGIHISLSGTNYISVSDHDGNFLLENVKQGFYQMVISGIGYKTHQSDVTLVKDDTQHRVITLSSQMYMMPELEILASTDPLFKRVPGSVSYISPIEIQALQPVNGNEVLRKATGLNVVDEEGLGLRTNIGIRGLDPDRSRTVLMLEDGVPVALAPYGEPEMYYTPAIERISSVEVLKGSGSILYGPQTIGGVINYKTIDPPASPEGFVKITGGEGGYFTGLMGYGTTFGKTGIQVNYLRKQTDEFGTTYLRLNDLTTKFMFQLNERSVMGLKFGIYNEESNSTYIGMTQPMYDNGNMDFVHLAPNDRLYIKRYSASVMHKYKMNGKFRIETVAFGYTTKRDWQRQDFAYNTFGANGQLTPKPSNYSGVTWGDETIEGGALYMRNSTGNRNRSFEVAGIEPRLIYDFNTGGIIHEMTSGVRFLYERAFEQRINGSKPDASSGSLTEDEIRTGNGYSIFMHDKIQLTKAFSVSAGLRFEYFEYERDIRRGRFLIDGVASTRDTVVVTGSEVSSLIPGAGFNVNITNNLNLFGGVHRGFAPPRVKDAISSEGIAYELDAELSWNYELGIRTTPVKWLSLEITGFYMDFENQVIPVSESSGGTGSGLVNGGRTLHNGIETGMTINTKQIKDSKYYAEVKAGASYTKSVFAADRYLGGSDNKQNIKGNFTPYAPEWNATGGINIFSPFGLSLNFSGNYVGEQFSDEINSIEGSADGRTGLISSHYTFDAGARLAITKLHSVLSVSVKNLTDERYISSRRPQGIRVGMPRMVFAGIKVNF